MRRSHYSHLPDALGSPSALVLAAWVAVAQACATGPQTGVRSDYRSSSLRSTSVSPFFARSAFSLSDAALDERLRWAEEAATTWLDERGVDVVGPDPMRENLESADKWNHFAPDGTFHVDLADSFESAPFETRRETQSSVLGVLVDEDVSRRFLLLGELLYQTSGHCRETADDYTSRARVVVDDEAPRRLPRPCVVTHFQARLVDAESGSTVWYNRRFREHHLPSIDASQVRQNIQSTVRQTLGGKEGLGDLVGAKSGES